MFFFLIVELGFDAISLNSMDATGQRDFVGIQMILISQLLICGIKILQVFHTKSIIEFKVVFFPCFSGVFVLGFIVFDTPQ